MNELEARFSLRSRDSFQQQQPLMLSANSHPSYAPARLNIKTGLDMKLHKTKAPEKPLVPYMRYHKKVYESVKQAHPEAKSWEIGKIVSQMWRDLSDLERQDYINEYEIAKADFCEQLKAYHNSPQYQQFLSNASIKTKRGDIRIGPMGSSISSDMSSSMGLNPSSYYAIEPAEDDCLDDSLTLRHLAAARFSRNNRLLNEIFSEYVVRDSRSLITNQLIEQFKKQLTSLENHQEILKQDLQSNEEKNEAKKRKFLESSADFENQLKKLNEFKVTNEQVKGFYDKYYEAFNNQIKESGEHNVQLYKELESIITNSRPLTTLGTPSQVTLVAMNQPATEQQPQPSSQNQPAATAAASGSSHPASSSQAPASAPAAAAAAHPPPVAPSQSQPQQQPHHHPASHATYGSSDGSFNSFPSGTSADGAYANQFKGTQPNATLMNQQQQQHMPPNVTVRPMSGPTNMQPPPQQATAIGNVLNKAPVMNQGYAMPQQQQQPQQPYMNQTPHPQPFNQQQLDRTANTPPYGMAAFPQQQQPKMMPPQQQPQQMTQSPQIMQRTQPPTMGYAPYPQQQQQQPQFQQYGQPQYVQQQPYPGNMQQPQMMNQPQYAPQAGPMVQQPPNMMYQPQQQQPHQYPVYQQQQQQPGMMMMQPNMQMQQQPHPGMMPQQPQQQMPPQNPMLINNSVAAVQNATTQQQALGSPSTNKPK